MRAQLHFSFITQSKQYCPLQKTLHGRRSVLKRKLKEDRIELRIEIFTPKKQGKIPQFLQYLLTYLFDIYTVTYFCLLICILRSEYPKLCI